LPRKEVQQHDVQKSISSNMKKIAAYLKYFANINVEDDDNVDRS